VFGAGWPAMGCDLGGLQIGLCMVTLGGLQMGSAGDLGGLRMGSAGDLVGLVRTWAVWCGPGRSGADLGGLVYSPWAVRALGGPTGRPLWRLR
jgi:hypothetical protein